MKRIPLSQDKFALVDDEDFHRVSKIEWHILTVNYQQHKKLYAQGRVSGRKVLMHRFILNVPRSQDTDHADNNGLNNQKKNLRICSRSQNLCNRTILHGGNAYRGVYLDRRGRRNPWRVEVKMNGKSYNGGVYPTAREAAIARDAIALKVQGPYCRLNFPDRVDQKNLPVDKTPVSRIKQQLHGSPTEAA